MSGQFVSPPEVEAVLVSHEAVLEAAVVQKEDDDRLLKAIAFVVLGSGYDASPQLAEDLKQLVKARLPAYKCPRWIEFVRDLHKAATGKMQRFKLRQMAAGGSPQLR